MNTVPRDVKVHIDVSVSLSTRSYLNTACINLFHKLQRHVVDESDGTINCIGLYPAPPLPVPHICLNLYKDKTSSQDLLSRLDSHLHNPYLSRQIVEKMAEQAARNNGFLLEPYLMAVNVVLVQDVFHKIPVSCLPGKEETLKKETTCAICLEDLWTNKQLKLPHCSHQFHFRCISKWLQSRNSCPLCREIVFVKSDFEWSASYVFFKMYCNWNYFRFLVFLSFFGNITQWELDTRDYMLPNKLKALVNKRLLITWIPRNICFLINKCFII